MIDFVKEEYRHYRVLFFILSVVMLISYSVYLFFDEARLNSMGDEDGLFEYLTAFFFFLASIDFTLAFARSRNIFFLLLAIILFVGCGEEISWGQRILGFGTPDYLKEHNVQGETTLHNIEILNSNDFDNSLKTGWRKLLTVDFLYKLFCVCFGGLLPMLVFYVTIIKNLALKINLPVPPILLGGFFVINWLTFKLILKFLLPAGRSLQYYDTVGEISEFISSVVFFIIALAFLKQIKANTKPI